MTTANCAASGATTTDDDDEAAGGRATGRQYDYYEASTVNTR